CKRLIIVPSRLVKSDCVDRVRVRASARARSQATNFHPVATQRSDLVSRGLSPIRLPLSRAAPPHWVYPIDSMSLPGVRTPQRIQDQARLHDEMNVMFR